MVNIIANIHILARVPRKTLPFGRLRQKVIFLRNRHGTHKEEEYFTTSQVWHPKLPFKISFLAWRIIHRKLPLDDTLCKFGTNRECLCVCCAQKHKETGQHLFIDNNIARQMWNAPLGICTQKMVVDQSKKQDSQNDLTHSSYGRYGDKGVLVNMVHKRCFGVEEWRTTSGGQLLS